MVRALNRALAKRTQIDAGVWTALIMVGSGLGMLVFVPLGLLFGVFEIPRLGLRWKVAEPLYIWGTSLAGIASVGGALAWTYAAQRLSVALSAQLITMEVVFGTVFGLLVRHLWPTPAESFGMTLLLMVSWPLFELFTVSKLLSSIAVQRKRQSRVHRPVDSVGNCHDPYSVGSAAFSRRTPT